MTPAERLLELTALTGLHTPAEHFLSITQTGGPGGDIHVGPTLSADSGQALTVEIGATMTAHLDSAHLTAELAESLSASINQELK